MLLIRRMTFSHTSRHRRTLGTFESRGLRRIRSRVIGFVDKDGDFECMRGDRDGFGRVPSALDSLRCVAAMVRGDAEILEHDFDAVVSHAFAPDDDASGLLIDHAIKHEPVW